jgi:hypothetical protein
MALFRTDFQGTVYGLETFQHGMHFSSTDSSAGLAADAAAAWLTVLATTGFAECFSTGVVWAQVNVSELGATPAAPIVTSATATINDGGTTATASLPAQCAPCLSFRTATAGSRARGRSFLPPVVAAVTSTTGRLISTNRGNIVSALDTFFATMASNAAQVVVVSSVGGVYTAYPVNTIALGDVIDTQRSRRSSIAEVYSTAAV